MLAKIGEVARSAVRCLEDGKCFVPVFFVLPVQDLLVSLSMLRNRTIDEATHAWHAFVLGRKATS
jgi:hypothetical protein